MIKIAINGFGRIGRNVFKIALESPNIRIIGINDLTDPKTLAHLLKYDSTQGRFKENVSYKKNSLTINNKEYNISCEKNPLKIPWIEKPDIVIESTGVFRKKTGPKGGYGDHLENGAKKVILTVPAKDEIDKMIVLGVNDNELEKNHLCISNASCTTNCLAPIVKILNDEIGIENGLMTTIHSYTNDQIILDGPHKDLRRSRSAALSQIPTTTGAATAVTKIIPELEGKLNGMAIRVPTPAGSLIDFTVNLKKDVSKNIINNLIRSYSVNDLKDILEYTEEPIVSVDIIHNPHSSVFDGLSTMVIGKTAKILSWYDNEWGYSNRIVDLINKIDLEDLC